MSKSQSLARQQKPELPHQQPPPKPKDFPTLLEQSKAQIAKLIHEPAMVERFARVALTEFRKNADLAKCTPESIMASVLEAARLNLEIGGALRQGYLVPYGGQCQFQPSYIGLLELARRSGEFRAIDAVLVNVNDEFDFKRDADPGDPLQVARPRLFHRPNLWDPGPTLGTYVYAILTNGEPKFLAMNRAEIETVRHKSRQPHSLMWAEFWGEGARKTVLKRFLKTQAQTPELARAIALDNEQYDLTSAVPANARVIPARGVAGLRGQLGLDEPTLPPQGTRVYQEADESAVDEPGDGETFGDIPGSDEAREGAVLNGVSEPRPTPSPPPRPQNHSGSKTGPYASDEQVEAYRRATLDFCTEHNARWADEWTGEYGELPNDIKDLLHPIQVTNHMLKVCLRTGRLAEVPMTFDPETGKPTEKVSSEQAKKYVAIVFARDPEFLSAEAESYYEQEAARARADWHKKHPKDDVPEGDVPDTKSDWPAGRQ